MGKPFIVLGDKTSHGGTVIGASAETDTHGALIARIGDMVSCPKKGCRGVFPIVQGDASIVIDGSPAAYHGCKVACGATLIASQMLTTTEPSGGSGLGSAGVGMDRLGDIAEGLAAAYEDEPLDEARERFRGRFQVVNRNTGQPIAGKSVRVRSTGGQYLTGTTDGEGYTQWVDRDAAEALAFDLIEQETS
ncbi:PAAR domain-containing protein [Aquabacterium sp. A7-Y]|uniref:PAAR domain-containing protein n=1 Tax=Aquabacterium sp. A7-Y TaxID=1349605 RepID=UPI00223D2A98|nr:PAAR domain-containing protein [Aquabacterium sp. A7-Y]MCW7538250.1 PAAR domain-containing protein [Aquabacterium sp. A7-Y]